MTAQFGNASCSVDVNGNIQTDGGILTRGRLRVVGALKLRVTSTAATSYVVGTTESVIFMSSATARLVTLPDATAADQDGRRIVVKDTAGTTAAISVIGTAGNVDGGTTGTQNTALGSKAWISDGTDWWSTV